MRRRRAAGGPAESAFATLVGLELRPRRLREAAAMWQAVTDAVGAEARDALWAHPDLVPDRRTTSTTRAPSSPGSPTPSRSSDDVDQALEDLLNDDSDDRPHED